jgi:hypothetical protein
MSEQAKEFNRVLDLDDHRNLRPPAAGLSALSGGGGGGDGLTVRVAVLEQELKHIADGIKETRDGVKALMADAGTIKVDVATLKENVRHLPGKTSMFLTAASIIACLAAAAVFLPKLQEFAGTAPRPPAAPTTATSPQR